MAVGPTVGRANVKTTLEMDSSSLDALGQKIHNQLAKISQRNGSFYREIGQSAVTAWRSLLGSVVSGAPLIGSAISGLAGAATMLAASLYESAIAMGGMLPILSSLGLAAVTASFGFRNIGKAMFEIDSKALKEQLDSMTPSAREFALVMRGLAQDLQRDIQPRMFAGLTDEITKLRDGLIPTLHSGFMSMADQINKTMKSLMQYGNSAHGLDRINTALQGQSHLFGTLSNAFTPALDGLLGLLNALLPAGERLATKITDIANRFSAWTQAEGFASRVDARMQKAEKTAGLLFKVLGNLGSAIANIFGAANPATNSFLEMLVVVTEKFKAFTSSVEGQQSIAKWASESVDVMRQLGKTVVAIFDVVQKLSDSRVIISFLATLQHAFEILGQLPLEKMVSKFADLAEMFQPISGPILAFIIAGTSLNILLGNIIGQVAGFGSAMLSTGKFAKNFFKNFDSVGKHAGQVGRFTSLFGELGTILTRIGKFAGPVGIAIWIGSLIAKSDDLKAKLGKVWDSLTNVFKSLWEALKQVWESLKPVLDGLQPVFDILDQIASLAIELVLDSISSAFDGLAKAIKGVGEFISGFIDIIVGIFTLDGDKIMGGLKKAFSGLEDFFGGIVDILVAIPDKILEMVGKGFDTLVAYVKETGPKVWKAITDFIDKIPGFFEELPGKIESAFKSLFTKASDSVSTEGPKVWDKVEKFTLGVLIFFAELPGKVLTWMVNTFVNMTLAIANAAPSVLAKMAEFMGELLMFLALLPIKAVEYGLKALVWLANAIVEYGPTVISAVGDMVSGMIDFFISLPGKLFDWGVQATVWLAKALVDALPTIKQKASDIAEGIVSFMANLPQRLWDFAKSAMSRVGDALGDAIVTLQGLSNRIVNAIVDAVSSLPEKMLNIGNLVTENLAKGIRNGIGKIKDSMGEIAATAGKFWPGSPVREGPLKKWNYGNSASGGGRNVIEAISQGLSNINPIRQAMGNVADAVSSAFNPTAASPVGASVSAAAQGPRGGSSVSYGDIQVTIPLEDLDKINKVEDFLAMLSGARVQQRKVFRSGTVTA